MEKTINHIVDWIKTYFVENGPECNAVIGISGGKDSTIAAALLTRALGPERVIGVLMPNGEQADLKDAMEVVETLGIRGLIVDISDTCNALYEAINVNYCNASSKVLTNTPARIRMTTLYAVAALYNGRVCNTCNRSEDYVGYSTKFGDSAGDFAPLANYTVTELLALGDLLTEIPSHLIHKAPADGMCGMTDEENLGFTYDELDNWILEGKTPSMEKYAKIMKLHKTNQHKLKLMPSCQRKLFLKDNLTITLPDSRN